MTDKHWPTRVIEPDMIDSYKCSCGWESKHYYDGAEHAYAEWQRHKEQAEKAEAV